MLLRKCGGVAMMLPLCIVALLYFHLSIQQGDIGLESQRLEALSLLPALIANSSVISKDALLIQEDPSSITDSQIECENNTMMANKETTLNTTSSVLLPSHVPWEKLSSVDSFTCCGLGHRLTRVSNAAHLANHLNMGLRVYWDFCGTTEVFYHFFGSQPPEELTHVNTTGKVLRLHNEVPGYRRLIREGPKKTCQCSADKVAMDARFYTSLRNRFRHKKLVDDFVDQVFSNHTVIGMHVRAGNGEQGDFDAKKRGINDVDTWVDQIAQNIRNMTHDFVKPPLLYIATDTPSMIVKFREKLANVMNVTELAQERSQEGQGVFFGESGVYHAQVKKQEKCLNGWDGMIKDMMVLSHADVVIASRPSSFVQTLPMSLVFDKPKENRSVMRPYCEFNLAGSEMKCFEDYMDWCCNGIGSFALKGLNQKYEYIKIPDGIENLKLEYKRRRADCTFRPPGYIQHKQCIPYSWPDS